MDVSSLLSAVNSSNGLKQAVGVVMLDKVKDTQAANMQTMLKDFQQAQAPHPYLGGRLDLSV